MLRILTPADYLTTPWKNGRGVTTEIAREPLPGASAAGFDFAWRLSMAPVREDGPFSPFAGIERTIVVIEGAGCDLHFDTGEVHRLLPFEPYAFDGGAKVTGHLVDGPIRDFNVMVRRDVWQAQMQVHAGGEASLGSVRAGAVLVAHALAGSWNAHTTGEDARLDAGCTVVAANDITARSLPGEPQARLLMVLLEPRA